MPTPNRPPANLPPQADDLAESQRFIDMAREVGVDEALEAFDRAFGRLISPKPSAKN